MSVPPSLTPLCAQGQQNCADCHQIECLATLAHELRHPLAPLSSGLAVLRLGGNDPLAVGKTLDMMERQLSQMKALIDDLMDVAVIGSGKFELKKERVALAGMVSHALETTRPLIDAAGHALIVDLPQEALVLDADPRRIGQVLVNLLNNAAKYTPAGGRIVLSARPEAGEVVILVTDNGVGISPASLGVIFGMFAQARENSARAQGGLGIGLSLVRRLAEMHGGTVTGASAGIDQGSTFTLRLPLAAVGVQFPSGMAAQPAAPSLQAHAPGLRILVVDDHLDSAQMLATLLELDGHTTAVVHDGCEALEKARQFKPQLVFIDIMMPGMNGYETAKLLRTMAGLEPMTLVALTGLHSQHSQHSQARSRKAGFDHHLSKPVELADIQALLARLA
ncbi:MAG: ATP-binding protein [Pseudomonadota bacterium]|nr:ATP-binding protein [Pseudomonadota bacterium]